MMIRGHEISCFRRLTYSSGFQFQEFRPYHNQGLTGKMLGLRFCLQLKSTSTTASDFPQHMVSLNVFLVFEMTACLIDPAPFLFDPLSKRLARKILESVFIFFFELRFSRSVDDATTYEVCDLFLQTRGFGVGSEHSRCH